MFVFAFEICWKSRVDWMHLNLCYDAQLYKQLYVICFSFSSWIFIADVTIHNAYLMNRICSIWFASQVKTAVEMQTLCMPVLIHTWR